MTTGVKASVVSVCYTNKYMKKELQIKLSYVPGLREVVFNEIKAKTDFDILDEDKDSFYISYTEELEKIKSLRSISRVYVVHRDERNNPFYVSNHKSILGDLISLVLSKNNRADFKTFKINCAGSDSKEIKAIKKYVSDDLGLIEQDEADMKIYFAKINNVWEIGIQLTPRPLSLREYKAQNMSGAMDPTVAYSLNCLCELEKYEKYLNIFSGSGTLMIEAGLSYSNLTEVMGFDNDKSRLSLSIQNIKKAGLIQRLKIKEFDIFDNPDIGKFDVITSDLPFGMVIGKELDLGDFYKTFIKYCEEHLNEGGKLGVFTSEFEIFEEKIIDSKFKIEKEVKLKLMTAEEQYLTVKILILGFK
jgi:tRNA G10  N-methylase Trm11